MTDAGGAPGAFFVVDHKVGAKALTFRVVAPSATKRTTFEKNGCPDAGAIVDGEFLYG